MMLIGRTVIDADLTQQDAGLLFDGKISLNIYNNFVVEGFTANDTKQLVGAKVTNVNETQDAVTLEFNTGVQIAIDLRDCAYTCPEAMQLRVPGCPIMIWN